MCDQTVAGHPRGVPFGDHGEGFVPYVAFDQG